MYKEKVVCPYCEKKIPVVDVLGRSGLINYSGMDLVIPCRYCENEFEVAIKIDITYKVGKR